MGELRRLEEEKLPGSTLLNSDDWPERGGDYSLPIALRVTSLFRVRGPHRLLRVPAARVADIHQYGAGLRHVHDLWDVRELGTRPFGLVLDADLRPGRRVLRRRAVA